MYIFTSPQSQPLPGNSFSNSLCPTSLAKLSKRIPKFPARTRTPLRGAKIKR